MMQFDASRKKFEMGLFDDPYKFSNKEREKEQWNNPQNLEIAEKIWQRKVLYC